PSRLVPSDGDQREGVGPVQTVNTPASRTRGQIKPSQRGQTKLSQPILLPGPNSLFVATSAAQVSRRAGWQAAAGVFISDSILMIAAVAGGHAADGRVAVLPRADARRRRLPRLSRVRSAAPRGAVAARTSSADARRRHGRLAQPHRHRRGPR
ncbi:MAG: hypothetical protein DI618_09405, partial [Dermacoccus nishinomiyaensis]